MEIIASPHKNMLFPDIILVNVLDLRLVSSVSWGFTLSPRLSFSSSAMQAMEADDGPEFWAETAGPERRSPWSTSRHRPVPACAFSLTSPGQPPLQVLSGQTYISHVGAARFPDVHYTF